MLMPEKPELNEIARVISGLPVDSSSIYHSITTSAEWKSYHTNITKKYRELDSMRFDSMTMWKNQELPASMLGDHPLLYPFSGPDFLTGDIFFPEATEMFLFGLERTGQLPDPRKMSIKELETYFKGMERSAADLLRMSFFRTNWMKNDMKANGVIPVMCNFMVHRGYQVSNVIPMRCDSAGVLVPDYTSDSSWIVKIEFIDPTKNIKREVTYFQVDLSDGMLKAKAPQMLKFFERLPMCNTYMKAASYLCYHKEFFGIAETIKSKSRLVLQEDTGLPFRHFADGNWNIQFYGTYVYPVSLFTDKIYRQNDELKNAYKADSANVKPLPFPLGYHALKRQDNLMRAIRKP
jgi:hypothetical protein